MSQPDLFIPEPVRICRDCVVWNGHADAEVGGCSVFGNRPAAEPASRRWFPKHELNASLYGRGK